MVNTSSVAARLGRLRPEDLGDPREWSPHRARGDGELTGVPFARTLGRRLTVSPQRGAETLVRPSERPPGRPVAGDRGPDPAPAEN